MVSSCAFFVCRNGPGDGRLWNHGKLRTMTAELAAPVDTAALAGKYLTFTLQKETYGLPVLKLREIIQWTRITAMPQMPAHVCGVVNLRGKIIPVMDLGRRFGLAPSATTTQTCIIVVKVTWSDGNASQLGLVVDTVEEVVNIAATQLEPVPEFGTEISTQFILGVAKLNGGVKVLLNLERVLSPAPRQVSQSMTQSI